jgi:hypothetical protein
MGFMMGFSAQGDGGTVGIAPVFPSNSEETMTPNERSPRKRRLSGIFGGYQAQFPLAPFS